MSVLFRTIAAAILWSCFPAFPALADEPVEVEHDLGEVSLWQHELTLRSTARWQIDNGNRATPTDVSYDPTGEDFGDLVSTIGGSISYENFTAIIQFDAAAYVHEPIAHPLASPRITRNLRERYEDTFGLEAVSMAYTDRDVDLTLGDFSVTLGRGLILAIRKVDDVGIDNKIRGGNGRARIGPVTLQAFGGVLNIKNFEQGTGFAFEDSNDLIAGGRAELSQGKLLKLAAHAAYIRPERTSEELSRFVGYGASVELPRPLPWGSLYLEAARLERDVTSLATGDQIATTRSGRTGHGLYGNANLYFGPATLLIEGKLYDSLFSILPGGRTTSERQGINRLSEPPSAERPLTLLLSNETVAGGRVRFEYSVAPSLVPYVAVGRYRDSLTNDADITAVYGGGRVKWSTGHVQVEVGYRGELAAGKCLSTGEVPAVAVDVSLPPPCLVRAEIHGSIDLSQKFFGPYSAELRLETLHTTDSAGVDRSTGVRTTSWIEGRNALSFKSSDGWGVIGAHEYYDKSPELFDVHYFSIGGQWEFMEGSIVRALYGGERAGLKCSGGACRFFPGFEGGRVELSLRI